MEYMVREDVFKEFIRKYDRNPKGWSFFVGQSPSFWDVLIIGPDETWQLKVDTIFKPKPLALGVRFEEKPSIKIPKEALANMPNIPYGFRPLPVLTIKSLVRKVESQQLKPEDAVKELINHLRNVQPKPVAELTPRVPTAIGPHLMLPELSFTSEKHRELSLKLEDELKRLLRREYPFYGV